MKRRLLLVSISAPPKNAPESLQAAKYIKYLSAYNDITLVTSKVTGGWRPQDSSLTHYLDGIDKYIELPVWRNKYLAALVKKLFPIVARRPDEDAPFHWQSNYVLKQLKKKSPDVIYSRSTPLSSHFLAYKLSQKLGKPWLMHLSDPWVDNPYNSFTRSDLKYHKYWEGIFFDAASVITLTSLKTLQFYTNKYPKHGKKFKFCPNVYDDDEIVLVSEGFQDKLTFVHTGRLYGERSAIPLLHAIDQFLKEVPEAEAKIEFLFAGFCDQVNETALNNTRFSCIKYLGSVSFEASLQLQRKADILVTLDANGVDKRYNLFFPSKILDYIITRKKILAITALGSSTAEILDGKYGWCFRHADIEGLVCFLKEAYARFQQKDNAFFVNNNIPVEFSASVNARRLEEIFSAL